MHNLFRINLISFQQKFISRKYRYYFQLKLLCAGLGIAVLLQCALNLSRRDWVLTIGSAAFFAACLINFLILHFRKRIHITNQIFFDLSICGISAFLLLSGYADQFNSYWVLLLAVLFPELLGRKHSLAASTLICGIYVFFLWIPIGQNLLTVEYPSEFCIGFPLAYIGFFIAGYISETIRDLTYCGLQQVQDKLTDISETDTLTGVKNRLWFDTYIFDRYNGKTLKTSSIALLIDIDGFKTVNDTYGHLVGDMVIRSVSETVQRCLGKQANLCRWGGEEFFAFIPSYSAEQGVGLCEQIRRSVENADYGHTGQKSIKITVSIGVVLIPNNTLINIDEILHKADVNLYKSKKKGKNTVCFEA